MLYQNKSLLIICWIILSPIFTLQHLAAASLPERLQESGRNSTFEYGDLSFKAYINQMKKVIQETRLDITSENRETILTAVSPFEILPNPENCTQEASKKPNGILLIHGLSDSPFLMRDLASFFSSQCLHVRSILLPGHGTLPGDLLSVKYTEWLKTSRYGVDRFKNKVDKLLVAGFSAGGALAMHMVLEDYPIDGLLLFAPAIALKSKMAFMAQWHKLISWGIESAKWLDIANDADPVKYESFTMNAAAQIYQLTEELKHLSRHVKIRVPIFMAVSADDMTVDANAAREFFQKHPHPYSRLLWYTPTPTTQRKHSRILERSSVFKEYNILNFSHNALTIHPNNPHYGKNGIYKNCLHYQTDCPRKLKCQTDDQMSWGEITKKNLDQHTIRRLTFNPDFPFMLRQITQFLSRVIKN